MRGRPAGLILPHGVQPGVDTPAVLAEAQRNTEAAGGTRKSLGENDVYAEPTVTSGVDPIAQAWGQALRCDR